jgi:hypothetical protein
VLEEVLRIALFDIATLFDQGAHLPPVHDWPLEALRGRQRQGGATPFPRGDGLMETVYEVKLWDKLRGLELAAAHLGLLKKKVEHSGEIDLVARLRAARQRGRAA